jgi:Domain of unknown function (DUF4112)
MQTQTHQPNTKPPLDSARGLARVLDDLIRIPGTRIGIGLDPILNLIPVAGDAAGTAMSAYLLVTAVRMQVPKRVIARMFVNISIDAIVGAIPVLGQAFDFFWKANTKNLLLLEKYAVTPDYITLQSGKVVGGVLAMVLILLLVIVVLAGYLTYTVFSWFSTLLQTI